MLCACVELDEDDMALMAEVSGDDIKESKTSADSSVKKDGSVSTVRVKEDEPSLPDYDAVVAADVEGEGGLLLLFFTLGSIYSRIPEGFQKLDQIQNTTIMFHLE